MKVSIVGYGYVGKGMHRVFPEAEIYDPQLGYSDKGVVNTADMAIVCVPTNEKEDGSADISIVEEVVGWIEAPLILIKSTIPPGTVDYLKKTTGKHICFSPEYMGEGNYFTPYWMYPDPENTTSHGFMVVGGDPKDCDTVADFFIQKMGPHTRIRTVTAKEAEIVKYAENTWGATKVIFAHLLRDVCEASGVSWQSVREGWLDDPRVEPMHTAVFGEKRGFGGKCFPKDLSAFLKYADSVGVDHRLLKAVKEQNEKYNVRDSRLD